MAASSYQSSGKRNYYNVSYGLLSSKVNQIPTDYTEITEAVIKQQTQDCQKLDLRKKYLDKGAGEYPYVVFNDSITGVLKSFEKKESEHGTTISFVLLDSDGEDSSVQVKYYSKYAGNILNRLLAADLNKSLRFAPYAIPTESEIGGKKIKYYKQGITLYDGTTKIMPLYPYDSEEIPKTETIKAAGKETTNRDKQLDALYEKFVAHFNSVIIKIVDAEVVAQVGADGELPF